MDQRGIARADTAVRRRAEIPVAAFHGDGAVSPREILRGDLVTVLYRASAADADYRFNARITDLVQEYDVVVATLSDGTTLGADLVVGADGPYSTVRGLVFGAR
ncbi:hypothetical protein A4G26_07210 [Mycobacterium kansasii]|uniref:FAD-binding domain-containing protein n=1 Tax=Mycobacterium innocens TaxID=2341083 RepID=A0A498PZT4_9MYCO|nr:MULTISPECIES: FAD-dependent monooxygenase [Mycobacterium]KZS70283.1 hypothetical protein A4G26_07210 [Mycobacterium kansasii]VBA38551.1 hypothetical protein LAUMK13_02146 [Mycobacterium innocens]